MFELFDRIVVINLPDRVDRRRETESELARVQAPNVSFFPAIRPDSKGPFCTRGEHGCYLSHMAVLSGALDAKSLLVLEDDVVFSRSFRERALLLKTLPRDWEILYAGHYQLPEVRVELPLDGVVPVGGAVEFIGTHCYGVNGAAIPKLRAYWGQVLAAAEQAQGTCMPIDGAINTARRELGLRSFAVNPPLADQRPSRTDVAEPRWFDRIASLRSTIDTARRLKGRFTRRN